jgi:hypothetical protein
MRSSDRTSASHPELAFLDEARLILSFDEKSPIAETPASGNVFSVLMLSALDGLTTRKLEIAAALGASATSPTADGDLVVLSGTSLKLYTNDFVLKKEVAVTPPICSKVLITPGDFRHFRCIYNTQRLDVSPDQKRLLIRGDGSRREGAMPLYRWSWFETNDLAPIGAWTALGGGDFRAGNQEFIAQAGLKPPNLVTERTREPVCSECQRAYFLTNDLRLETSDRTAELKNPAGLILYRTKLSDGVNEVAISRDNSLFAYVTISGGIGALQLSRQPKLNFKIHVCDWKDRREVTSISYQVVESGEVITSGSQSAIAISPNGHTLALLVDSSLALFHI